MEAKPPAPPSRPGPVPHGGSPGRFVALALALTTSACPAPPARGAEQAQGDRDQGRSPGTGPSRPRVLRKVTRACLLTCRGATTPLVWLSRGCTRSCAGKCFGSCKLQNRCRCRFPHLLRVALAVPSPGETFAACTGTPFSTSICLTGLTDARDPVTEDFSLACL